MIAGIGRDKADRYGARFLKLIKDAQLRYNEMRGSFNENVTLSENEFGEGDDIFEDHALSDEEEEGEQSTSRFFSSRQQSSLSLSTGGPLRPTNPKTGKRSTGKRSFGRRGKGSVKSKGAKARANSHGAGRFQKGSTKGASNKSSRSAIEMMPA